MVKQKPLDQKNISKLLGSDVVVGIANTSFDRMGSAESVSKIIEETQTRHSMIVRRLACDAVTAWFKWELANTNGVECSGKLFEELIDAMDSLAEELGMIDDTGENDNQ